MHIYQAYDYHLNKKLLLKCELLMSVQQSVRITNLILNFNFSDLRQKIVCTPNVGFCLTEHFLACDLPPYNTLSLNTNKTNFMILKKKKKKKKK